MGKPTGFLEYERVEAKAVAPKERIKNFNEFHTPLSETGAEMPERTLHGLWCAILSVRHDYKGYDKWLSS